mmetsp:Transcript_11940/g.25675  ORF Transcript_11940/g.25675 Transcript_11940/m.25675 type:complete len:446 (-) Transcript_11940:511-1848(-)
MEKADVERAGSEAINEGDLAALIKPTSSGNLGITVSVDLSDDVDAAEAQRREKLRKAGADYLSQAMAQATKGQDPFQPTPTITKKARKQRPLREDPEFVAFGKLLKDALVYVYIGVFLVTQSLFYVLVKVSFHSMQTPAVLTFLHMLAASLGLWLACHYDVFEAPVLTVSSLKGSALRVTFSATQMLCTFSALHHNSVNLVLVWTTVGAGAIDAGVTYLLTGRTLSDECRTALLVAAGAGVLEIFFDNDKVPVGILMMSLWAISKAAECVWRHLKADASAGGRIQDMWLVSRIRGLADEEEALSAPTLALLQNAVPAVPVLLLGFMCLEGKELVDHELSVPAVRTMLLACACYTLSTGCQLLLDDKISPRAKLGLRAAALLGTILVFFLEEIKTISFLAVLLTLVSTSAAMFAIWRQRNGSSSSAAAAAPHHTAGSGGVAGGSLL